jgi:hypothetical protein
MHPAATLARLTTGSTYVSTAGIKTDDWYLDDLDNTWDMMYTKDPLNDAVSCDYSQGWANCTCPAQTGCYFNITDPAQVSHALGGEVGMLSSLYMTFLAYTRHLKTYRDVRGQKIWILAWCKDECGRG